MGTIGVTYLSCTDGCLYLDRVVYDREHLSCPYSVTLVSKYIDFIQHINTDALIDITPEDLLSIHRSLHEVTHKRVSDVLDRLHIGVHRDDALYMLCLFVNSPRYKESMLKINHGLPLEKFDLESLVVGFQVSGKLVLVSKHLLSDKNSTLIADVYEHTPKLDSINDPIIVPKEFEYAQFYAMCMSLMKRNVVRSSLLTDWIGLKAIQVIR